ncbi:hypothetical protein P8452_68471 [Trifolium repens]|nr:hypothetical protein P8452_68471 [Trifolium repens]
MADLLVTFVNRLASESFGEFGRIYGVMNELEKLKNNIESIKAVLHDAEDKQEENHAIQNWIRKVKDDVLHPADDLLDEFLIEDMRMRPKMDESHKNKETQVDVLHPADDLLDEFLIDPADNLLDEFLIDPADDFLDEFLIEDMRPKMDESHKNKETQVTFRSKMARAIERIQKKINELQEVMTEFNLAQNDVVVEQNISETREACSFVFKSLDIIGREDDKKEIISLLRQPHEIQNVSLVAIVGIGGLGKTTLAHETIGPVGSPVHVSLELNAVHLLGSLDGSRLRTLILLSSDDEEELYWEELYAISSFQYLRVLKLSHSSLSKLSRSIGKLKHLRYLNLSRCTGLGSLFKSISIIVLLQTLILMPDEKVEFSKMAISKLINLRHLQISDWEASEDKKFEKLSMQPYKVFGISRHWKVTRSLSHFI